VSHNRRVQDEFTRQAEPFARSATLKAPELTERIGEALGPRASGRILDLACGPGVLTTYLCRSARIVIGLDLTHRVLEVAKGASDPARAAFVRGAAERAAFADGSFDAVAIRLALHHVMDAGAVLREVRRLLRPGGRVAVLDVLTSEDPRVAALHNEIERARDPSHTAFVPAEALRSSIEAAGLSVASEQRWQSPRSFTEWAAIIDEPERMDEVAQRLRAHVDAGETLGIDLRATDRDLFFDYRWALIAADAP
jgi:ubiquinone/menaquinone biosynthesis C-methylase UbiE